MIKPISMWEIPSLSAFDTNSERYKAWLTPAYNIANYVCGKGPEGQFSILTKLQLLKALLENGEAPFYAADLFGTSDSLGGWIGGLQTWNIIKPTGNHRDVMIPMGGDLFRKCEIAEWQLEIHPDELDKVYSEITDLLVIHLFGA